jgi:hypothetical protein
MRASAERDRALSLALATAGVLVLACANVKAPPAAPGSAGSSGGFSMAGGGAAGAGGAGGAPMAGSAGTISPVVGCQGPCADFPELPSFDVGVTPDAAAMFALAPPTGPGPCITEPESGALYPYNWLRPRVKFTPLAPGVLHEVRFHSDKEQHDLVAYTLGDSWTMPRDVWQGLAASVRDSPITVTVRALGGGESTTTFTIAPVPAPGSIVFWAANPADHGSPNPSSSSLQGFAPGDEATVATLSVPDVQMRTRGQNNSLRSVTCIGCHASTPDGESVAFVDNYPWSMAIAGVMPGRTGLLPSYVTLGGTDAIRQPGLGIFSFSKAHWTDKEKRIVAPYYLDMPCGQYVQTKADVRLAWLDVMAGRPVDNGCPVEGVHFGIIAREGDMRGAANPTWSHDGETIVYSSTVAGKDGRLDVGPSDLFFVPYAGGSGGIAKAVPGAAQPDFEEYYPAYSPDDALVVFDRVPAGGVMYANPMAELFVVPAPSATDAAAAGSSPATATRLVANDPPTCSGKASPGINNHWAKWAPAPVAAPGTTKTYYWLIFSSNRYGTPPVTANDKTVVQVSQLYVTAIALDGPSIQTFPAIYLWNQNKATLNTTPAWDPFKIPVVP